MAWTQSDLDALESSIKRGTRVVQFSDRRVEYHSLSEMLKLRDVMRAELGTGGQSSVSFVKHSKLT